MIKNIYYRELAALHVAFLELVLAGCSAGHAAPLPPPPVTCTTPVTITVTAAVDVNENPVSFDTLQTKPPICACSDKTVRLCGLQ